MAATRPKLASAIAIAVWMLSICRSADAQANRVCTSSPAFGSALVLAALAIVPIAFIATTSFVKLSIVFSILRNALGIGQTPSGAIIAVLAAVLSLYVMMPVGRQIVEASSVAASNIDLNDITSRQSLQAAFKAFDIGKEPLGNFLKNNSGKREIALFVDLSKRANGQSSSLGMATKELAIVLPAFLLTELKEAFQIGFLIYIPLLVIDMVIANLLLAMGMQTVSAATVSLPFKLLIFVLVDGWYVLAKALVVGYRM